MRDPILAKKGARKHISVNIGMPIYDFCLLVTATLEGVVRENNIIFVSAIFRVLSGTLIGCYKY